jgi:hypothetical protein
MKDSILVIIIAFFVGITSIFFFPSLVEAASFKFEPSEITTAINSTFDIEIIIDTNNEQVGGAGAIIRYDTNIVTIKNITAGDVFADYPVLSFDNKTGQANISGIVASQNDLYEGKGTFAKLSITAINSGKTSLSFDFEKGKTNDSNIATTYAPYDILTEVNTAEINVTANISDQSLTSNSLEPTISPDNELTQDSDTDESFLSKIIAKVNIFSADKNSDNKYSALTRGKAKTDPNSVQQPATITNFNSVSYIPFIILTVTVITVLLSILLFFKKHKKSS